MYIKSLPPSLKGYGIQPSGWMDAVRQQCNAGSETGEEEGAVTSIILY